MQCACFLFVRISSQFAVCKDGHNVASHDSFQCSYRPSYGVIFCNFSVFCAVPNRVLIGASDFMLLPNLYFPSCLMVLLSMRMRHVRRFSLLVF